MKGIGAVTILDASHPTTLVTLPAMSTMLASVDPGMQAWILAIAATGVAPRETGADIPVLTALITVVPDTTAVTPTVTGTTDE